MYSTILLDLDEVLVDFVEGFGEEFGYDFSELDSWDMGAHVGITKEEFFHKLNTLGHDFWANLPKTDRCDDIIEMLGNYPADFYIVSSPTYNPGSWSGKKEWVVNNLPAKYNHDIVLTSHKHLLANQYTLLIDDRQKNVDNFKKCNGWAIPYPKPWNDASEFVGSEVEYIWSTLGHKEL